MPKTITIAAVGDVMLREAPAAELPFADLRSADLRVANLEGPITERGYPADKLITLRMPPEAGRWVRDLGFEAVSLANNHALDYGTVGLDDTLTALTEAGIAWAGAGSTLAEALRSQRSEVAGVGVATVALAATVPPGFAASDQRPGIAPLRVRVGYLTEGSINEEQPGTPPWVRTEVVAEDLERALAAVREARGQADIVLVQLHWGVPPEWNSPFQGELAEYQRPLAHALIDAGASVILGHHPHALHGVERYREALVFYSLGNFLFHPHDTLRDFEFQRPAPPFRPRYGERNRQSLIAGLEFESGAAGWRLRGAGLVPAFLDGRGEPRPASEAETERIFRVLLESDATAGVDLRIARGRGRIDLD